MAHLGRQFVEKNRQCRPNRTLARGLALAVALILLLSSAAAWAMGSIRYKTTSPKEVDGKWKLKCTIDYGATPNKAHVPMVFSFKHVTQYEWYVNDKSPDKALFRKKPLQGQTPINLDQPVGFSDAMGKVFRKTRYSFKIPRDPDLGFEAGEYLLTVRVRRGPIIGRPTRITLKGKNKVIDFRSISFVGEQPVKPKATAKTGDTADAPDDGKPKAVEDLGPSLDDDEDVGADEALSEAPKPPAEKPKQGGCGCRVVGHLPEQPSAAWLLLGLAAVAVGVARRRSDTGAY